MAADLESVAKHNSIGSAETEVQIEKFTSGDRTGSTDTAPLTKAKADGASAQTDPYNGKTEEGVIEEVNTIVDKYNLEVLRDELVRGARLAYSSENLDRLNLSDHERRWLQLEKTHKWRQTWTMYFVAGRSLSVHVLIRSALMCSSSVWLCCYRPRHGPNSCQWSADVSRH